MTETRNEYFDSESLSRMGTALDEAWRTLPSSQQTPEMKIALAKAILHLEAEGELDPAVSRLAQALGQRQRDEVGAVSPDVEVGIGIDLLHGVGGDARTGRIELNGVGQQVIVDEEERHGLWRWRQ